METADLIKFELTSWLSVAAAITFVWGNILYVLAVAFFMISFRVYYLRARFRSIIAKVEQRTSEATADAVWGDVVSFVSSVEQKQAERHVDRE